MKFYLELLVVSAIFIVVTRAQCNGRDEPEQELQTRNLDVVDQTVQGQDDKQQIAYYSDGSEQEYHDIYSEYEDIQGDEPVNIAGHHKKKHHRKLRHGHRARHGHRPSHRPRPPQKPTKKQPPQKPTKKQPPQKPTKKRPLTHSGDEEKRKKSRRCEKVKVHTLPVGQGDCTVIYCHTGHAVLFDCGRRQKNNLPTSYFQSFLQLPEVKSITVMISHGDEDHYNLIPKLFDQQLKQKIKQVIFGGPSSDYVGGPSSDYVGGPSSDYRNNLISNWLSDIDSANPNAVRYISNVHYEELDLCGDRDIVFEILARTTNARGRRKKNERGMVMKLSCKSCNSQLLFAGDMEGGVADEMVAHNSAFLSATHYKMAHHGASLKANGKDWLRAISPVEVHVSHVYNGRYKYPQCDALDRVMSLRSLGKTTSHVLDCFIGQGMRAIRRRNQIEDRIYSTAPLNGVLCTISLTFVDKGAETKYDCGNQREANRNDFPTC